MGGLVSTTTDREINGEAMTLNQIRAFVAVSKYLNITRAAESLSISEPSVFKQVKSLEDFCGVRLYRKVGRQIELTREGQLAQADVREILMRVERLGQRFTRAAPALTGGSLRVGGSHTPSVALFRPSWRVSKKAILALRSSFALNGAAE